METEKEKIDRALELFTNEMRARMYEKIGKRGWDDTTNLQQALYEDVKGVICHGDVTHLHDIANRAMMLWYQKFGLLFDGYYIAEGRLVKYGGRVISDNELDVLAVEYGFANPKQFMEFVEKIYENL